MKKDKLLKKVGLTLGICFLGMLLFLSEVDLKSIQIPKIEATPKLTASVASAGDSISSISNKLTASVASAGDSLSSTSSKIIASAESAGDSIVSISKEFAKTLNAFVKNVFITSKKLIISDNEINKIE